MFFLVFSQHFNRDKGLDFGRLTLNHLTEGTKKVWMATSSTANKQAAEDFHQKGGPIPPQYRCGIKNWVVSTKPIPMPQVVGVSGNFYKIDPHLVTTDKGGKRGDFGVHLDANAPGSLGCIVMEKTRFADFEKVMKELASDGVSKIPLFVQYS